MTRLGEMLRLSRVVQQRSLRDAARSMGIGYATLHRIEQGKAFDAETMLKIWVWLLNVPKE